MKKRLKNLFFHSALAIILLHSINLLVNFIATIKELLPMKSGNYYDWRFGKIYYEKQGSGNPLLLIHDLNAGGSGHEWNAVVEELAKTHTVYAIDLLGCGRSEKPKLTYTNFLYVQLLSDFIKNVIGHKTDVLASGSSAQLVLMACHYSDTLFNRIVLVNPDNLKQLNKVPSKKTKTLKFLLEIPIIGTTIYHILTGKHNFDHEFMEYYFYNPFKVEDEHIHAYYEAAHLEHSAGKYLYASLIGGYLNANILPALKAINQSIYIIGGEKEAYISDTISGYQEWNPSIEAATIEKSKHFPHLEVPEKFLDTLSLYL